MGALYDEVCSMTSLRKAFRKGHKKNSRPGPDGISWRDVKSDLDDFLLTLRNDLVLQKYQPDEPEIVTMSHYLKAEKLITFNVVNVRNRIVEYSIRTTLEPLYEREFLPFSCAYQPGKGEKYFARMVAKMVTEGFVWFACTDVKSFFPSIDIAILTSDLLAFTQDRLLIDLICKCLFIEGKGLGIPLGHVLSPFLSNIFLHPIDLQLRDKKVIRFSDDYFFPRKTAEGYLQEIEYLERLLSQRGLSLNHEKSRLVFRPQPEVLLVP